MTKDQKDSVEAVHFMALFTRLKEWIDDTPEGLTELAASDDGIKKLCTDLYWVAFLHRNKEKRGRELFTAPVDPKFLSAWRDYEERFETAISEVWLYDVLPELASGDPSNLSKLDQQWEWEDSDARRTAGGIETAINFAKENIEQDSDFDEDVVMEIEDGLADWEQLKHEAGFDLRGVFRRRALVPFVLVPRQVSDKYGQTERPLLKNLQQAHDAFIFGASFAALALMRSIGESVLRDHYKIQGADFCQRINNARGRLPRAASIAALHRLRLRANTVLHLKNEDDSRLPELDEHQMEKEIVTLLFVLRALIEGVK